MSSYLSGTETFKIITTFMLKFLEEYFNPLAALKAFEKLDVTARNNVIDWRHLRAFLLTSYLRRILMYFNGV